MKYVAPQHGLKSFTCPHCGVLARQYSWAYTDAVNAQPTPGARANDGNYTFGAAKCEHCGSISLWVGNHLVYPDRTGAPPPNPEMPDEVRADYLEAGGVLAKSPRGAAALLRLAIQKLCAHLGEKGENINADIGSLVAKGLPVTVQRSLDVVRVTGNNAVHPGQIHTDDIEVAGNLFPLVNVIVEYMIAMPKHVAELYSQLPPDARAAIERRDGSAPIPGTPG